MKRRRILILVAWLACALAVLVVRARPPGPLTSEERTAIPSAVASTPTAVPLSTPATRAEVDAALIRAFAGTVEAQPPDAETGLGDFNGDGAQDLAVVVQRAEARAFEVNDALRNWSVEDVAEPGEPGGASPGAIEEGERLLAIVHGHGPAGFRNPEARQSFLLKNAAGARLSVVPSPISRGDLLKAEIDGVERVLYWTGARYARKR